MAAPRIADALLLLAVAGAALGAGCGGARGPLSVSWRFADGRRCADSGAGTVQIDGPVGCRCGDAGTDCACQFTCQDGERAVGGTVTVDLTGGGTLSALAVSPVGGVLYRGTLDVGSTDAMVPVVIDLYFTGGR